MLRYENKVYSSLHLPIPILAEIIKFKIKFPCNIIPYIPFCANIMMIMMGTPKSF